MINDSQTAGWQKYSHEQFGLPAWGASGPYQKVYEKFGITGSSEYILISYKTFFSRCFL